MAPAGVEDSTYAAGAFFTDYMRGTLSVKPVSFLCGDVTGGNAVMSNAGSASVSSMLSVSSDVVEGLSVLPCMFAHLAGCITPHSLYPGFYKLVGIDNESLMLDGVGIVDIMVHVSIMWRLLVLGRPRLRHGMVREVRLCGFGGSGWC